MARFEYIFDKIIYLRFFSLCFFVSATLMRVPSTDHLRVRTAIKEMHIQLVFTAGARRRQQHRHGQVIAA